MSLILDALKKLERDKEAREPNVLVVGSVPWGTRARSRLPLVGAGVAVLLIALLAVALWPRATPRPTTATPSPARSSPGSSAAAGPIVSPPSASAPTPAAPEPRRLSLPSGRPDTVQPQPAGAAEGPVGPTTAASAPKSSGTEELRLTAISQRDGRPVALINDRLVFEGDGCDGVKVLRIGDAEVEVEVRGVKKVLRF